MMIVVVVVVVVVVVFVCQYDKVPIDVALVVVVVIVTSLSLSLSLSLHTPSPLTLYALVPANTSCWDWAMDACPCDSHTLMHPIFREGQSTTTDTTRKQNDSNQSTPASRTHTHKQDPPVCN